MKSLPAICINLVGDGVDIPEGFLPFGLAYGDSVVPSVDDGSSEEIQLETDVFIFGSRGDSLYVSLNYRIAGKFWRGI